MDLSEDFAATRAAPAAPAFAGATLARQVWRAYTSDRMALVGLAIVVIACLVAIFAPWISPQDPLAGVGTDRLLPPLSPGHVMGTDGQGRDVLSRLIWGARMSLGIGIFPTVLAFAISLPLGLVAGYFLGWVGEGIMRVLDIFLAFPVVLLGLAIVSVLGDGMLNVMFAIVVIELPYMCRIVYTEAALVRGRDYVTAAQVCGSGTLRIITREVLPNVLGSLVVYSTTIVGSMILIGAGFSFLGIGIKPPTPDWGIMTSDGAAVLETSPHITFIPGVTIVLVSLAFNWVGDGLRLAVDARNRSR
jgi:ABC-type dipeptide/oligopeptide/nickel transport system permease subunit